MDAALTEGASLPTAGYETYRQGSATNQEEQMRHLLVVHVRTPTAGDGCVVVPSGEVDASTVQLLVDRLDGVTARLTGPVTVDCSSVSFIDSAGVEAILACEGRLRRENRRLLLYGASAHLRRVLEVISKEATIDPTDALPF